MPDQTIFCTSPWYELHIYWDGSLGFCCQESHKLYPSAASDKYNIKNISIAEWFDSEPMHRARLAMHGTSPNSFCSVCHYEEAHSNTSRRLRCNQKSVIFTRENFSESYQQSPGWEKFEHSRTHQGQYNGMPIDLHINLGNYCNLTCKMCDSEASSSIAVQKIKWGITEDKKYVGSDWTKDESTWHRVLEEIVNIKKLHNVHFMGGETLITKRFEEFVDCMIEHKRFNLNFSFVTNGTSFNPELMNKLMKFQRVGIEVSIESTTEHNAYQRQGTDTSQVLSNITKYLKYCNNSNITLTLRPAVSALTIGSYHTLLEHALENKLLIKSFIVSTPDFLNPIILPDKVKKLYLGRYQEFKEKLNLTHSKQNLNISDPNNYQEVILEQVEQIINLLSTPQSTNAEKLFALLVSHCRRWDNVHGYNALEIYPELKAELVKYGY